MMLDLLMVLGLKYRNQNYPLHSIDDHLPNQPRDSLRPGRISVLRLWVLASRFHSARLLALQNDWEILPSLSSDVHLRRHPIKKALLLQNLSSLPVCNLHRLHRSHRPLRHGNRYWECIFHQCSGVVPRNVDCLSNWRHRSRPPSQGRLVVQAGQDDRGARRCQ